MAKVCEDDRTPRSPPPIASAQILFLLRRTVRIPYVRKSPSRIQSYQIRPFQPSLGFTPQTLDLCGTDVMPQQRKATVIKNDRLELFHSFSVPDSKSQACPHLPISRRGRIDTFCPIPSESLSTSLSSLLFPTCIYFPLNRTVTPYTATRRL